MNESILDAPRQDLDGSVWEKNETDEYRLTGFARQRITGIVEWIVERFGLGTDIKVNITGSITSNQYSDDSDIDIHIQTPKVNQDNQDEKNRELRLSFEEWKNRNPAWATIGKHPIEVYFQVNEFQDLMSVGCYDFMNSEWLVGPDFKDQDFDAYYEYYNEDMRYINSVITDIRNVILKCYERAMVIDKSQSEEFKNYQYNILKSELGEAAAIFTKAREFRKIYSAPTSREDALEKRSSHEWKIADSAFKLMDKFGYLNILRTYTKCWEALQEQDISRDNVVLTVLGIAKGLSVLKEGQTLDEGLKEIALPLLMAVSLNLGAAVPKDRLESELSRVDKAETRQVMSGKKNIQDSPAIQTAINNSDATKTNSGAMSVAQVRNAIQWTIWSEANNQYARFGKKVGKQAIKSIASVLMNRANNNPSKYTNVISTPSQFSEWNSYSDITNPVTGKPAKFTGNDYVMMAPTDGVLAVRKYADIWAECGKLADDLLAKRHVSNIGKCNMIANKNADDPVAYDSWGKKCTAYKIGDHSFGYEWRWDGKRNYPTKDDLAARKAAMQKRQAARKSASRTADQVKPSEYQIQSGESLSVIAKKFNTTVNDILALNKNIKNPNKVGAGMKILVRDMNPRKTLSKTVR